MGKVPGLGRGGAGAPVGIPPDGSPPILARPLLDSFIPASSADNRRMSLKLPSDKYWQRYTVRVDLSRVIKIVLKEEANLGKRDPESLDGELLRQISLFRGKRFEDLPERIRQEIIAEHMLEHIRRGNLGFDDLPSSVIGTITRRIRHLNIDLEGLLKPLFRSRKMLLKLAGLGILFPGQIGSALKKDKELILEATKKNINSVANWYLKYGDDSASDQKLVFSRNIEVFKDPSFQLKLSEANFSIYLFLKALDIPIHRTVVERFSIFIHNLKKLKISHILRLNTKVASEVVINRSFAPDTRPTALLIYNRYDYNRAFERTIVLLENLIDQGYRVVYHEVDTDDELRRTIISEGKKKSISLMVVAGHGNPKMTLLGKPNLPAILPNLPIAGKLFKIPVLGFLISSIIGIPSRILNICRIPIAPFFQSLVEPAYIGRSKFLDISDGEKMKGLSKYFEKGSTIVLLSCSTGEKGHKNLKDFMAGHFPESRVLAPLHVTTSTSYFKFGRDHRVEDFVFIYN